MAVDAILGLGGRLYYSTNSGSSYTELTDLAMLGGPGTPKADEIDATPVNPTGNAKEFLIGLIEYGEHAFEQYFKKTRFTTLNAFFIARTLLTWKLTVPDNTNPLLASNLVWAGYLKECQLSDIGGKNPVTIKCKTKLSGGYIYTEGS